MPNVPDYIDSDGLRRALQDLGIQDIANLRGIDADAYRVTLHYFATNESGQKYLIDGAPAELSYEVPVKSVADSDQQQSASAGYQQVASAPNGS